MKPIAGLPLRSRIVRSVNSITFGEMPFRSLFLRSRAVPCLNSRIRRPHWSYAPPLLEFMFGIPLAAFYFTSSSSISPSPSRILRYFFNSTAPALLMAGLNTLSGLPSTLILTRSSSKASLGLMSLSSLFETVSVLRRLIFRILSGSSHNLLECKSSTVRPGAFSRLERATTWFYDREIVSSLSDLGTALKSRRLFWCKSSITKFTRLQRQSSCTEATLLRPMDRSRNKVSEPSVVGTIVSWFPSKFNLINFSRRPNL